MTHNIRPLPLAWAATKTSSSAGTPPRPGHTPGYSGAITLGIALRYLTQRRPKATLLPFPRKSGLLPPAA